MELIPSIRDLLEQLEPKQDAVLSGRRAALWRAQQHAARVDNTVEDLRRYCLESLEPRRFLDEEEYMRGFRQGFQAVLKEIRRVETQSGRGTQA